VIQPDLYAQDTLNSDPDELEEDEASATADADGLRCLLEAEVLSWFETRKKEMPNPPLITPGEPGTGRGVRGGAIVGHGAAA